MFDDLQQLFGYRGAIDERSGISEVGPDLLVLPCWTPAFCATVIRAAEALGAFEQQPDDPVPGHEVSLAIISPRLFEMVQEDFGNASGRSCKPYGHTSTTTACVMRSSSATPQASRSHCGYITMLPKSPGRSNSTMGMPGPPWSFRGRVSTTLQSQSARCWCGHRWSPIPTKQRSSPAV